MKNKHCMTASIVALSLLAAPSIAVAQSAFDDDTDSGMGQDPDPHPTPPGLDASLNPEMQEQAGTGGTIAYAEQGVVEVGGSATGEFTNDLMQVSARPSVGWFLVDNFELSAILEFGYSELELEDPDTGDTIDDSATIFGVYAEPSLHIPFSQRTLGFVGVGVGPTYDSEEFGFSVRPRLGVDLLLGRSGILRPALEATYSTVDVVSSNNQNLVGVSTTLGMSLGFSVML